MLLDISVRGLYNDMIKPSGDGELDSVVDLATNKLLIIDTTLRSFIPPQVRKMTPYYIIFVDVRFASFPRIFILI